jgi:protein tyrosine/serine phosphatase
MSEKKPLSGLIIILLILAAIILLVRHFHIRNFNIIKPAMLYTSGQPRGMDYTRLLYKYHIATIVNVRSAAEHRERNWYNEEIIWAKSNGVNYIELPIRRDNYFPDKQTQDRFFAIMADKDKLPVLLHGSGGKKRVAMLTAVWLKKTQKYTAEEVFETVEKINGDRKLTEAEKEFINSQAN